MDTASLKKGVYILLFLFLLFGLLYYARAFLIPLTFAGLFSMLLLPVFIHLEKMGMGKALSAVITTLILLIFFVAIITLLVWQISDMAENAQQIEENMVKKFNQVRSYISRTLDISPQVQEEIFRKQQSSLSNKVVSSLTAIVGSIGSIIGNLVLILVYVFLLLYFWHHFRNFILKLVPAESKPKALKTMYESRQVAQKYLTGLALMIGCLWIMYSIGFSIIGVKNAFFFAILCGLLEIVPFVGNLTGSIITMLMSLAQGGNLSLVWGIVITYGLIQFVQTYILEPIVVGGGVNLNPLFTIAGIIAGELLWGIPGMILAIPLLGIAKIICDNVEVLKPYGYLIGQEKKAKGNPLLEKIKGMFGRKTG